MRNESSTAAAPATSSPRGVLRWIPVRLVLLFVALAAIDLGCQYLGALLVHAASSEPLKDAARLVSALLLSAVMIVSYRGLVKLTERRAPLELGRRSATKGVATGILVGAGLFALVYVILWALGAVVFEGYGGSSGFIAALAVAIASAVGEEIAFRGVVFRLLEDCAGTAVALLVSAAAFGLVHAGNQGATWVSTLAIALESGTLLGLVYAATRSLWLPIGLHFGWNFTEGGIFGAAVSGGHNTGLVVAPLSGPPILTGGDFGPEASIVAMAVSLIASAALVIITLRAGEWRRRRWSLNGEPAVRPI
jgi:uncharacterized protein